MYEYFTHRVKIHDLDGNLISWRSFTSKRDALTYKINLESQTFKEVGKIELEVIRIA